MAKLGVRTVDELVGRTDLIRVREELPTDRAAMVDLSRILDRNHEAAHPVHFHPEDIFDFKLDGTLDETVLIPRFARALEDGQKAQLTLGVSSTNRTLGTIFGSEITRRWGNSLPDDTFTVHCIGGGGQSFGAFIPKGLTMELEGDSNDYFGKGLSGGKLIVYPPKGSVFSAQDNIIIGNVALYGATSGAAYINGIAGERFCVRNSGATAVVEGVGNHGCEYMTGGRVVVLGNTGKNFAAGMSGGTAYVLDADHQLYLNINKEMVSMSVVSEKHDIAELRSMIEAHVAATGSELGKQILADFASYLPKFKKVIPNDYSRMLIAIGQLEEKGMPREEAEIEAFYQMKKA